METGEKTWKKFWGRLQSLRKNWRIFKGKLRKMLRDSEIREILERKLEFLGKTEKCNFW